MPARAAQEAPFRQATAAFGEQLRSWRQRRRMSQLELAGEADISTRHLSYVETGRSNPSREMVLRLAARLDVPLRERNALLLLAGYAPVFPDRAPNDVALAQARVAIDTLLHAHDPFPALASGFGELPAGFRAGAREFGNLARQRLYGFFALEQRACNFDQQSHSKPAVSG